MDMNKTCAELTVCSKTPWSSIIAGAFIAIGLMILFKVLTLGIGLAAATKNETGMLTLMVSGFIWLLVGSYITLFLAGWVTGLLVRDPMRPPCHGILYGFLLWSISIIICLWIESSAAGSILFAFSKMFTLSAAHSDMMQSGTDTVQHANKIGVATLSTFFILLSSALGSCFGTYFGMKHCKTASTGPQTHPYQQ